MTNPRAEGMEKSVLLANPCYRGFCFMEAQSSWMVFAHRMGLAQRRMFTISPPATLVSTARQQCVDAFLSCPAQAMLFVDEDMTFTSEQAFRLLDGIFEDGLDFVSAVAFSNEIPTKPCIFGKIDGVERFGESPWWHICTDWPRDERFELEASGFGMVALSRKICETMAKEHAGNMFTSEFRAANEDISFSINAKRLGFSLWCDPKVSIGHINKERSIIDENTYNAQGDSVHYYKGLPVAPINRNGDIKREEEAVA